MVKNISAIMSGARWTATGMMMERVFRLIYVGDSTEKIVRDGDYKSVNPNINSANFPIRLKRVFRDIMLIESDQSVTLEEALAEALERGLERPVYEDALHFGVEYPWVQRKRCVVFLHEPWQSPCGRLKNICLCSDADGRKLGLSWFGNKWEWGTYFAFVVPVR